MEAIKEKEKSLDDMSEKELKFALPREILCSVFKNIEDVRWAGLGLSYLKSTHPEFKPSTLSLNEQDYEELWNVWSGKGRKKKKEQQ